MAKKPSDTPPAEEPKKQTKYPAICNNCKFSEPWNDLIFCNFKAPPHFQIDLHHKARLVQPLNTCSLHQPE